MQKIILRRNPNRVHKFRAVFPDGRTVLFGARGYSDYTKHKDAKRKARYVIRHRRRENWTASGRYTAGFWSRWLLWSVPSLRGAVHRTEQALGGKYKIFIK
jgi:hypothetical protein